MNIKYTISWTNTSFWSHSPQNGRTVVQTAAAAICPSRGSNDFIVLDHPPLFFRSPSNMLVGALCPPVRCLIHVPFSFPVHSLHRDDDLRVWLRFMVQAAKKHREAVCSISPYPAEKDKNRWNMLVRLIFIVRLANDDDEHTTAYVCNGRHSKKKAEPYITQTHQESCSGSSCESCTHRWVWLCWPNFFAGPRFPVTPGPVGTQAKTWSHDKRLFCLRMIKYHADKRGILKRGKEGKQDGGCRTVANRSATISGVRCTRVAVRLAHLCSVKKKWFLLLFDGGLEEGRTSSQSLDGRRWTCLF